MLFDTLTRKANDKRQSWLSTISYTTIIVLRWVRYWRDWKRSYYFDKTSESEKGQKGLFRITKLLLSVSSDGSDFFKRKTAEIRDAIDMVNSSRRETVVMDFDVAFKGQRLTTQLKTRYLMSTRRLHQSLVPLLCHSLNWWSMAGIHTPIVYCHFKWITGWVNSSTIFQKCRS